MIQPRGRGEHLMSQRQFLVIPGSAPRTRGTPELFHGGNGEERFSPADAGNTDPSLPGQP